MIKNKKLFIFTLLIGIVIVAALAVPYLVFDIKYIPMGWWCILNCILGVTIYTLLFISLKKTPQIKGFYVLMLLIATYLFVRAILMLCGVVSEF